MKHYVAANRGVTLLELIIGMSIMGIVASISVAAYDGYIETTKVAAAKAQIRELSIALDDYALDYGAYPTSLAEIGNENLRDPWGNPYQYLRIPKKGEKTSGSYSASGTSDSESGSPDGEYESSSYSSGYESSEYESDSEEEDREYSSYSSDSMSMDREDDRENDRESGYMGKVRKDRNLVPINSNFDLYSMGKDGKTRPPLTVPVSKDDVIYANDGAYIGLAEDY